MTTTKKKKSSIKSPREYTLEEWAKKWSLDAYEIEIEKAFEAGEMKLSANQKKHKKEAQEAAKNFFKKNARLNIRLTNHDLMGLKQKAALEGLPYQTLAASIIHKYVAGTANYRME